MSFLRSNIFKKFIFFRAVGSYKKPKNNREEVVDIDDASMSNESLEIVEG